MASSSITRDRFGGIGDGEIAGIPVTPVVVLGLAAVVFAVLWKKLGKR